jgi:hypothetical protein
MFRALLPVAMVAAFATSAAAEKQKVAVLGLEVTGSITYESTNLAKYVTDALREQVRGSGKLVLAPNSNKDLIDEKITHGCDKEEADCMAKIGKSLGADQLMYGRIFKKKKDGVEGYQLELKLLDIEKKSRRPSSTWIPLAETIGSDIHKPASRAYKDLIDEDIDTVTGPIITDPVPSKSKTERGSTAWKAIAVTSGAVALGAGAVHIHAWQKLETLNKSCTISNNVVMGPGCDDGPKFADRTKIFLPLSVAALGFTVWATYKGFISKRELNEKPAVASKRKRAREGFVVTPIVSPDGAGATIRLDW